MSRDLITVTLAYDYENMTINDNLTNTSQQSQQNEDNDDEDNYLVKNTFIIFSYTIIILVSCCGNLLVLRVVFGKKKMRTTTNLFIASLALADFLTTTLNIPFNVSRFLLFNYPFGRILCVLVPFIQVCCVYVSTLTMAVIAIHRYWTITSRQSASTKSLSVVKLSVVILAVWTIAGVLALPHSVFNKIVPAVYKNETYNRCRVVYPSVNFDFPFWLTIEAFFTQYLIPLSITCTLYIKIGFIVSMQGRIIGKTSDQRKRKQDEARRRRIIMLVLVVAAFAACWLPLNTYHLLRDFKLINYNFNIFLVCHWIAMSSVCYNPFIYCWLNESFRKGAQKLFIILCWCINSKVAYNNEDSNFQEENTAVIHNNETQMTEVINRSDTEVNRVKLTHV